MVPGGLCKGLVENQIEYPPPLWDEAATSDQVECPSGCGEFVRVRDLHEHEPNCSVVKASEVRFPSSLMAALNLSSKLTKGTRAYAPFPRSFVHKVRTKFF